MRTNKPLKTVEKWLYAHAHMIDEYWIEDDESEPEHGNYSYWIYLKKGYINPFTETHCVHEATARGALEHLNDIKPCSCFDCES